MKYLKMMVKKLRKQEKQNAIGLTVKAYRYVGSMIVYMKFLRNYWHNKNEI